MFMMYLHLWHIPSSVYRRLDIGKDRKYAKPLVQFFSNFVFVAQPLLLFMQSFVLKIKYSLFTDTNCYKILKPPWLISISFVSYRLLQNLPFTKMVKNKNVELWYGFPAYTIYFDSFHLVTMQKVSFDYYALSYREVTQSRPTLTFQITNDLFRCYRQLRYQFFFTCNYLCTSSHQCDCMERF